MKQKAIAPSLNKDIFDKKNPNNYKDEAVGELSFWTDFGKFRGLSENENIPASILGCKKYFMLLTMI